MDKLKTLIGIAVLLVILRIIPISTLTRGIVYLAESVIGLMAKFILYIAVELMGLFD